MTKEIENVAEYSMFIVSSLVDVSKYQLSNYDFRFEFTETIKADDSFFKTFYDIQAGKIYRINLEEHQYRQISFDQFMQKLFSSKYCFCKVKDEKFSDGYWKNITSWCEEVPVALRKIEKKYLQTKSGEILESI